jgi:hypothetical protein
MKKSKKAQKRLDKRQKAFNKKNQITQDLYKPEEKKNQ